MNTGIRYTILHDLSCVDIHCLIELTRLINDAYRGVSGSKRWTTEHHLVDGDRISLSDLRTALADPAFEMIVAEADGSDVDERILGCIAVKYFAMGESKTICEFGTFAVLPELHGNGLGKAMLRYAEEQARSRCSMFQVVVVAANTDLIHFYKKLGYQLVGESIPYPVHLNVGVPKRPDLELVILRKSV